MQTSQDIRTILKTRFGYDDFRPLQAEVIRAALGGQDCFALMPTGAGKSICYQLPALAMDGLTIVVSPLIALMKDQVDALKSNGVSAAFLNSAQSWDEQNAVRKSAFEKRLDLLYVAPERIPQAAFRHFLDAVDVSLIAVDEAHCISEWGHEFRPEYRNLKTLRALKPAAPVMALTATATERAREDIVRQLELREPRVFVASFDRPNLRYSVLPDRNRNEFLDKWLSDHPNESAIIYRGSRAGADETAERLADVGVSALPYHAGLDERTRTRNQERFVRDEARVIAATVAFGMGIDKPNVRLVMHYETPSSVERYYQESGRAGRDGLEADCVMFHGPRERDRAAYFIERMEDGALRAAAERNLDAITAYCQTASCRREALLAHFGERYADDGCANCDNCLADTFDATIIAQKILSAVIRTGGRYGATYIAQVLRGSDSAQIRQRGHETLSVFGIVDDFSEAAIKELAASMSARGMLAVGSDYPTLSATAKGREFLRLRESVWLPVPTKSAPRIRGASASADPASDYDAALFEKLRALRSRLASELGVPPYVIFGDRPLREMCHNFPQSPSSLLAINGVGQRKLEDYGAAFLEIIADYARENGGIPDKTLNAASPSAAIPRATEPRRRSTRRYDKTLPLADLGLPVREIAERLSLRETTVAGHVENLIASNALRDPSPYLPERGRLDQIIAAIETVGDARLKPIYQHLGEAFDYEEIRFARAYYRARNSDGADGQS